MSFYKKYPANYLTVTAGADSGTSTNTVDRVYCTDLTQSDNAWQGWYFYLLDADTTAASGQERPIAGFDAASQGIELEYPLGAIPADTAEFELLVTWPAQQIHEEINNVILESWKVFPTVQTDRKLIMQEDKLEYFTSDFAYDPAYILSIQVERSNVKYYGVVSAGDTSAVTFTATDLGVASTDLSTGYYWSFYAGAGAGQSGEIPSAGDSDYVLTVTASDYGVAGDTTTKYCVWKYATEEHPWYTLEAVRWEQVEWPTNFFLTADYDGSYGMRFKVKYIAGNTVLNRRDRQMHAGVAEYYDTIAERYAQKHPKRVPPGTVWNEDQQVGVSNIDDPLGWT
jgi:hypothetical protein